MMEKISQERFEDLEVRMLESAHKIYDRDQRFYDSPLRQGVCRSESAWVDPDDAPELTGEELEYLRGEWRLGGRLISPE